MNQCQQMGASLLTANKGARLPEAYQEVEWISDQASGGQSLNTLVTISDCATADFILDVNITQYKSSECDLLTNWPGFTIGIYASNRIFFAQKDTSGNTSIVISQLGAMCLQLHAEKGAYSEFSVGDVSVGSITTPGAMFSANEIKLFKGYYGYTANQFAQVKSLKMYADSVLVRDFVPCYRKVDDVIGMYDMVSGVFFINSGTGTFVKGDDVN